MKETFKDEFGIDFIPEFMTKKELIQIPVKTHKSINFISTDLLIKIHPNIKVAKELCLYFLSMLTSTLFNTDDTDEESKYKSLLAANLATYFRKNGLSINTKDTNTYQRIIEALKIGTPEQGPFIIVDERYVINGKARKYRLSDCYSMVGFNTYKLTTKYVKDIVYRNQMDFYSKVYCNTIAKNMLHFYGEIELPTTEELLEKAKELVAAKFVTKKQKKLTMLHRQNKEHWKDADNRSFVEENIKKFEYYTSNGFMIPIVGGEYCPRVYDSISLIPSWIRNEIKVDGEKLVECDYKCLHPNLIMKLYKGSLKYITHENVANELGLTKEQVKIMHLSFFNMENKHIENSPLYKYYNEKEPILMKWLMFDKQSYNHKYTSTLLFNLEVQIMSEVIKRLNNMNIFVGYGYDALFTNESNKKTVEDVMNIVIEEFDIYTATYDKNNESNDNVLEEKENELNESEIALEETIIKYTKEELYVYIKSILSEEKQKNLNQSEIGYFLRNKTNESTTFTELLKYLKPIINKKESKVVNETIEEFNKRNDEYNLNMALFGGNNNEIQTINKVEIIEELDWFDKIKETYPKKETTLISSDIFETEE